jgi:putative ABC transport system permease protein
MMADLLERLRALFRRGRWSAELTEEMRFHLERETEARIQAGVDPATARREAQMAFGGVDRYMEETRDANGIRPLEDVTADARFALRSLRRNPGFTATAIGVLALAIGATTAVLCVVHAVLLADLPYADPDRLVRIYNQNSPVNFWTLSVVDLLALRDDHQSFESFGASRFNSFAMAGAGDPEQIQGARADAGFFATLGVTAATGRVFAASDEAPGAPAVAVVTDGFATRRFGSSPAAVGRVITLDGTPCSIVGVLRPGVNDLAGMRVPVWAVLQLPTPTRRGPFGYRGYARLKPGVSLTDASRDLVGISARLYPIWQSSFKDKVAHFTPIDLRRAMIGDAYKQIELFAGAVVLVLLVAIANVATLMLVRASARGHELSVRSTLGASRPRLARLVITECLVLTGLATVAGLALAVFALRLVGHIAPGLPRTNEISLDLPTVLIALGIAVVSGLLISVSPVAGVLGGTLTTWKGDLRRSGGSRGTNALRGVLVGVEFALAVPLLLAAALLGNSFLRLQQVDPGYDSSRGFSVSLNLPQSRYPDSSLAAFWRSAVALVSRTPGVLAVGLSTSPPPDNGGDVNNFNLIAHPVSEGGAEPTAPWPVVNPGFFASLGIPLVSGRLFTDADTGAAAPVVVVSRSWANHYFPHEDVLGQRMYSGGCYTCPPDVVVGVVGDVKYEGLAGNGDGVYSPLGQTPTRNATMFVRTAAAPETFVRPVTSALRSLDPQMPLAGVTLDQGLKDALADPGRWTTILSAFAVAALGLSAMGVFGLMSYVVRRQRREIGVRMALGAEPRQVTGMIVGRGMRYVTAGTLVGLALALLEARWIGSLLYGVTPHDPATLGAVVLLLLAAAAIACLLPGLRAAHIKPLEAIASE